LVKLLEKGLVMEEAQIRRYINDSFHVLTLILLIMIILGIMTWAGVTKCSAIPGWCSVYYLFAGEPNILIVYGETGLGDPFLLEKAIENPEYLGKRAEMVQLKNISPGLLKNYKLVIVDRAKKMSTEEISLFIDYVSEGGKLVWIGDSGTEPYDTDLMLLESDRSPGMADTEIGPWARKQIKDDANYSVDLDKLLSVSFIGNYCDIKTCGDEFPFIGYFRKAPGPTHDLVKGLDPRFEMRADFSVVKKRLDKYNNEVLTVDAFSAIIDEKGLVKPKGTNYGDVFSIIMVSSASGLGETIVYFAVPPETFSMEGQPNKTFLFVENMYYALLE